MNILTKAAVTTLAGASAVAGIVAPAAASTTPAPVTTTAAVTHTAQPPVVRAIRVWVKGKWELVRKVQYRYFYGRWHEVVTYRWVYIPGHFVTIYLPALPTPLPGQSGPQGGSLAGGTPRAPLGEQLAL